MISKIIINIGWLLIGIFEITAKLGTKQLTIKTLMECKMLNLKAL